MTRSIIDVVIKEPLDRALDEFENPKEQKLLDEYTDFLTDNDYVDGWWIESSIERFFNERMRAAK